MPKFVPDPEVTPGTKTVAEVVAELLKLPQDAIFEMRIGSPGESAWSRAEIKVALLTGDENIVQVSADVFSDDPEAFFPGLNEEDE